jgi:hypothetical protein
MLQVQLPQTAAAAPLPLPLCAAKALLRQNPFALGPLLLRQLLLLYIRCLLGLGKSVEAFEEFLVVALDFLILNS